MLENRQIVWEDVQKISTNPNSFTSLPSEADYQLNPSSFLHRQSSELYDAAELDRTAQLISQESQQLSTGNILTPDWVKQFGSDGKDYSTSIAAAADGSFYMAGSILRETSGVLSDYADAWVGRFAADGTPLWIREISTPTYSENIRGLIRYEYYNEAFYSLSIDSQGNLIAVGTMNKEVGTWFQGDPNSISYNPDYDIMVAKFDPDGNPLFSSNGQPYTLYQFSWADGARDVKTDSNGNIYIAGQVFDNYYTGLQGGGIIFKIDSQGTFRWGNTLGEEFDEARGIALDGQGNVYVTGTYAPDSYNLNNEAFVAKYNNDGIFQWGIDVATSKNQNSDVGEKIAVDAQGNIYVIGNTARDSIDDAPVKAWFKKFSPVAGKLYPEQQWSKDFLATSDYAYFYYDVDVDATGQVYVTGYKDHAFLGIDFAIVDKYDPSGQGQLLWTGEVRGSFDSVASAFAMDLDSKGNIFLTGSALGNVGGTSSGDWDVFYGKFSQSPTVTITATDARAAEVVAGQTPNRGRFTLTRTGDLRNPLTVKYTVGGTATKGTDYKLTGTATFAAGSNTAIINVNVLDDTILESKETVVFSLVQGAAYTLGTNKRATVTITDNEPLSTIPTLQSDVPMGTTFNDLGTSVAHDEIIGDDVLAGGSQSSTGFGSLNAETNLHNSQRLELWRHYFISNPDILTGIDFKHFG